MILAAIDIGSNAARILICEVEQNKSEVKFNRLNLLRIPLGLGFDVFEKGIIGSKKRRMLVDTIKTFKQLMKVYEVDHYMACATSAMRDAENSKEIIREIEVETSIEVEIISGQLEAEIIYENHIAELLDNDKSYLYIDVGGGSTELTLYHKSNVVFQKSFNIGTVRILTNKVKESTWDDIKELLKETSKKYTNIIGIGSGGNINKVMSLNNSKNGGQLSIETIKNFHAKLQPMSIQDRMDTFIIKKDRAEVIVPALHIYMQIMKWADIDQIQVPKIGLVDGLIHHLYMQVISE